VRAATPRPAAKFEAGAQVSASENGNALAFEVDEAPAAGEAEAPAAAEKDAEAVAA
jgi:hypothetical protein